MTGQSQVGDTTMNKKPKGAYSKKNLEKLKLFIRLDAKSNDNKPKGNNPKP
jgi:hypothetical protein